MSPIASTSTTKASVELALKELWPDVVELSRQIHSFPEPAYVEYATARTIVGLLRKHGFDVELGIAQMPTAFRATRRSGPGPSVAFFAELDAVQLVDAKRPSYDTVAHGCGHNVIASAAVGAALAVAALGAELPGRVLVFGAPAEESDVRSGGKELLRQHGWLNGLAAAMQIHPADRTYVRRPWWPAWSALELRFKHASERPLSWDGEAGPHPFESMIAALKKVVPDSTRLAVLAPPAGDHWTTADRTELAVVLHLQGAGSRTLERVEAEALERVAALAAEHSLKFSSQLVRNRYDSMVDNLELADAYLKNVRAMGVEIEETAHPHIASLGDMGNVSHAVPSIHPFIGLGQQALGHSSAFAELVGGESGEEALWIGSLSMALTAVDVLVDAGFRARVWDEFLADPRIDL